MSDLISYWRDGFDWRAQEARLNEFDQYKTVIDGLDIHFIHQRSPEADALPIIHAWVAGMHINMVVAGPPPDMEDLTADHTRRSRARSAVTPSRSRRPADRPSA